MPAREQQAYVLETIVPLQARTTSGNTEILDGYGLVETMRAQLNVTAASGTSPTLNVVIEDSLDGANWNTIGTFTQRAAVGREVINITSVFGPQIRVRWTIAGTAPSFTFDVVLYSQWANA